MGAKRISNLTAGALALLWALSVVGVVETGAAQPAGRGPASRPAQQPADLGGVLTDAARMSQPSTPPGASGSQASGSDLDALVGEVISVAKELKDADQRKDTLRPKIVDWKQRLDRHNAQGCTYPEGRPEVCAAYDREARNLDAERDRLKAMFETVENQQRTAKNALAMLKVRIRLTAMTQCRCAADGSMDSKVCLDRCFDGVNPKLKSCLDISDPALLASCLLSIR